MDLSNINEMIDRYQTGGCRLFEPYQKQREFFALGARHDVRCLSGGNRVGKTTSFYAGELAYHLTGEYPEWWEGRRWERPIVAWVGSEDWSTNVAGCQRILCGDLETGQIGRGFFNERLGKFETCGLPLDTIAGMTKLPNVPHALSSATVHHKSGGLSKVRFIAYSKGRKALQAGQVDIVGMDEEPPEDVATELMARTVDTDGMAVLTFTPLLGMSEVVKRFVGNVSIDEDFPEVLTSDVGAMIRIRARDTPHLGEKQIAAMERKYPEHEHMARIEGIPALGEGAIFPFKDSEIMVPWFQPPTHWRILDAVDFGWTHPTARVRGIMNPDNKQIFLIRDYKAKQQLPSIHAAAWKREFKGKVPVIWPHDGRNTETDGRSKMAKYQEEGVRFTTNPAMLPTGGNSLEGGVQLMYSHFASGLLKVWSGACPHWAAERMLYRREKKKNGISQITEVFDDCMDASRYVVCGLLSGEGVTIAEAFAHTIPMKRRNRMTPTEDSGGYGVDDPLFRN